MKTEQYTDIIRIFNNIHNYLIILSYTVENAAELKEIPKTLEYNLNNKINSIQENLEELQKKIRDGIKIENDIKS